MLKEDAIYFLDDFHVTGKFTRGANASFIALIPKIRDPKWWGDYRPISLVGCMYNVVSYILARRL